ncbi:immunity protein [Pseudomonas frederiksbergensis]|uniref:Immunity protein n=1 Tax=Pseudomonas frederiksbergensis TaxID=104087 RepID=A0A423I303_9PSED|nr:immunity protein [Pseudomonas frederiksbergensis]
MTALEQIVKTECIRDLLLVFAISLAFPSIDRMFGRYRFDVIASGELVRTYERLFEECVLAEGVGAVAIKGPNWKAPQFVIEKRYVE